MSYSLQQTISVARGYCFGIPLTSYQGGEPAISIANTVIQLISNPPFTWPFNRANFYIKISQASNCSNFLLKQGQQDYTFPITNFNFLEKVSLLDSTGAYGFEIKDIYNRMTLGVPADTGAAVAQPNAVSVESYIPGTSVSLRFLPVPDQAYSGIIVYQQTPTLFTTPAQPWPFPSAMIDVFNSLFVAEAMQISDDPRAAQWRQRGMAGLLAKAEGLSATEKLQFLSQFLSRDMQSLVLQLQTQQAVQARAI